MNFKEIYTQLPYILIAKGLSSEEWDLLNYFLKTLRVEIIYWDSSRGEPYLHPSQILLTSEFSQNSLRMGFDWALPISVLGRLSPDEREALVQKRVVSFWDLNEINIFSSLPYLGKKIFDNEIELLIWTKSLSFREIFSSLVKFFPIKLTSTDNPEFALQAISQNSYHLIVLDWDQSGLEVIILLRELRNLKTKKRDLPEIIGIKDFDKMNVFKDLSSGIREFCGVLFTPEEVLELFLRSFPIQSKTNFQINQEKDFPVIFKQPKEYPSSSLYLDYKKETRIANLQNKWTKQEIDKFFFTRQFDWILNRGIFS